MTLVTAAPRTRTTRWPATLERAWQALRFRDALLVSLLPLAVVGYALASSLEAYRRAQEFLDWFADDISVPTGFAFRVRAALRLPAVLALRQRFDADARDPGIIRLDVPGAGWDSVVATDLGAWDSWTEGTLSYGGTAIPIRVRKRGDFSVHWLTDKRSLTVRTPRDQFYKQFRSFGLSAKSPLESFVANRVALSFGLMVPRTEVAPVFLNNEFYGVYRFVEPVDESFLRPFDRMPGNIFRGDRASRGEFFRGQHRGLFVNPHIWDRAAVSDRPTAAGAGQLRLLLEDLNGGTFEDARRMMARFDRAELARLIAYLLLMGDPGHMDGIHNQLLYEDPSTQLLHPIPWDIRLLSLDDSPPPAPLSELMRAWLRDPFVVDGVARELQAGVTDAGFLRYVDSLTRGTERRYAPYFDYDRRREGLIPDVGTAGAVLGNFQRNVASLRRWLTNDTVGVAVTGSGGDAVLDLEARGLVGVDLVALTVNRATPLRVWRDANLNGQRDGTDPEVLLDAVPVSGEEIRGLRYVLPSPVALQAGWDTERPMIRAGHLPYRLFVSGLPAGARLEPELRNRATGLPAATVRWAPGTAIRPATAWHPWRYPVAAHRTWRLAGNVRLAETLQIPAGDTLVIAPGTTLRLAPEVSIVSRGRVIARGTAAAPIRILPDDPARPWGTFSLLGHGADSSVVAHAEIASGGGALVDRIEYIGMVNVHHADAVVFDHVFFHDNVRSDDTFHALHASVTVSHSRFLRANGDAIDFDISSGTITGTTIDASVNDGIDLMTSTPWVSDNVITGSGDKGISVGEASRPVIFNNRISGCVRGIEVKDRSEPIIVHNELVGNGVSLRERRKNWRYGGGPWATIALTAFRDNRAVEHDPFSRWTLWGTTGLDSLEEAAQPMPSPAEVAWLYAGLGVTVTESRPGWLAHWARATPVAPLDQQRFVDDFASESDTWTFAGGATRLEKRDNALVMEVERRPGTAARPVSWNLASAGVLIVQVAGRDLAEGRLVVTGDAGDVATSFVVSPAATAFRMVALRLPAGRYYQLRVEATPRPGLSHSIQRATGLSVLRAGRLLLRGFELYPARAPER